MIYMSNKYIHSMFQVSIDVSVKSTLFIGRATVDVGFTRANCLIEDVKIFYATAEVCAAAGLIRIGRFYKRV